MKNKTTVTLYRIVVKENFNDVKIYIPQVGVPQPRIKGFLWWSEVVYNHEWFSIVEKNMPAKSYSATIEVPKRIYALATKRHSNFLEGVVQFGSEDQALIAIEKYKQDKADRLNEFKNTLYKDESKIIEVK